MVQRDLRGTILAGCRLNALIGRGSMGEVWQGVHLALKRPVALKILAVGPRDADGEEAILREARALARVEHPNVVKVYDVKFEDEALCMILELVEGRTLQARVQESGAFGEADLYDAALGAARGVAAIHGAGLVHRDLKLDNVVMTDAGAVKITDFGLAVARGGEDGYKGCVVGTPPYISPEQWIGRPIDGRADLYALGVMLYACATGAFPYQGKTVDDYKHAHLKTLAPKPDVDAGLAAVLLKLLKKDRNKRYQTIDEVIADLERCRRGERPAAAAVVGKKITCAFCGESVAPVDGVCPECKEAAGPAGPIELSLREDEFKCPSCKVIVRRGQRACPGCAKGFCQNCLIKLAAAGGLCAPCAKAARPPTQ
ncbi:MAG TPA: serine/threonine-protein kinase [Planctomycetota bacterium]